MLCLEQYLSLKLGIYIKSLTLSKLRLSFYSVISSLYASLQIHWLNHQPAKGMNHNAIIPLASSVKLEDSLRFYRRVEQVLRRDLAL
jgi:hypothetical protein